MGFKLREYIPPDFNEERFKNAPDAVLMPAEKDGTVPERYHAMAFFLSILKSTANGSSRRRAGWTALPFMKTG